MRRRPCTRGATRLTTYSVIASQRVRAARGPMTGSAKQSRNLAAETVWIAHMGIWCVKWDGQLFVRLQASSSSRPCGLPDGARRSGQDRPVRAAAKRLGLDVSEHAIRLLWSGVAGGGSSYRWRSQGRAGFGNLVCMPDQTHIRSSRDSDCTNIPLAAGRLERTGPFFVAAFEAMQSIGSSTRIGRG